MMKMVGTEGATVLDLDNRSTWEDSFLPLLQRPEVQELIHICRSETHGEALLGQLESGPDTAKDEPFEAVQRLCVDILLSGFTHVIACHGCRIANPDDYLSRGLLRSDPDRLVDALIACAPELQEQIRAAVGDLGSEYCDWNRGTVGLLLSQQWAMSNGTHYAHGSELIQGVIHRVGSELALRYVLTGKPSLIRCRIPLEWVRDNSLTEGALEAYATKPLTKLLLEKLIPVQEDEQTGTMGGFRLSRDIPAHLIEQIVDMSQIMDDSTWIRATGVQTPKA